MPSADLDLRSVERLRLALFRLSRRVHQQSEAGLTPSKMSALSTIERHGPLRLGELAAKERISKSSVTRIVSKLVANGHVTTAADPTDGRSLVAELTTEGRDLLDTNRRRAEAYLDRQVAGLTADDRDLLERSIPVLERLLAVKA